MDKPLQPPPGGQGEIVPASMPAARVTFGILIAVAAVGAAVALGLGAYVIAAILGVVTLVLAVLLVPSYQETRKWHRPEFEFDHWPLNLGSRSPVTFRVRAKGGAIPPSAPVTLTVECNEKATYRVGTDTRTDTATVCKQAESAQGGPGMNGFEARFDLLIPADAGAPSMDLGDNEIEWRIRAEVGGSGFLRGARKADIIVGPTLDPKLIAGWGQR